MDRGKVGDDAVKAATCKVAPKTSGWWRQMVKVEYERARGLRKLNQKTDGFALSASRTLPVPIGTLYKAWSEARTRKRWLADPDYTLRKATRDKSLRITWVDGETNVNVYFWDKGAAKSQVSVNHDKLAGPRDVTRLKAYWRKNLDRLAALLKG